MAGRRDALSAGRLILCIGLCESAGLVGLLFTRQALPTWYVHLAKPPLTPAGWVFGPVWTALYLLMGTAAYLLWRRGLAWRAVRTALTLFVVQLLLNAAWSPAFFGLRSAGAGLLVIVLLWSTVLATTVLFLRVSRAAGLLLVPYLGWVSFATYLNAGVWWLNR